jgi:predicted transporter
MKSELNILLWIIGMTFSLGIFSIKVGLGLGFSRVGIREVALVYGGYLLIFLLFSLLADKVVSLLDPIIKRGPYIHAFVAVGFISWAIYILKTINSSISKKRKLRTSLLLLVMPCPVCVTAIAYSTWAAVWITKASPVYTGLILTLIFLSISTIFLFVSKLTKDTTGVGLSISLFIIGSYFLLSLVIPSIIQEAKGVYNSFVRTQRDINISKDTLGVFFIAISTICAGYIIGIRRRW